MLRRWPLGFAVFFILFPLGGVPSWGFNAPRLADDPVGNPQLIGAGRSGCLKAGCHGPGALLEISNHFDLDAASDNDLVLSQHNITYQYAGEVGNSDLTQMCTVCHPANPDTDDSTSGRHRYVEDNAADQDYPGNILRYPDAIGSHAQGDLIKRSTDFSAYEEFCLSCHDGVNNGGTDTFGGPLPAQQVAPSDPADPTAQQSGPQWVVPAVPPKDFLAGAPFSSTPPFFLYYRENGHGAASPAFSTNPTMNLTCLAGGDGQGCHNPHGSRNRFLMDDSLFGIGNSGIDSPVEFGSEICYGCHIPGVSIGSGEVSGFHGWKGDGTVLHDDSLVPVTDGMGQIRKIGLPGFVPEANMNINLDANIEAAGLLPFYPGASEAEKIHQRSYPAGGAPLTGTNQWVHCLTCHDPHGTNMAAASQPGMLREYFTDLSYADPLCGQCHKR